MRVGRLTFCLAATSAVVLMALPVNAQGSPSTLRRQGLEKVHWYHAPIEIQITDGPGVRRFPGGYRQEMYAQPAAGVNPGAADPGAAGLAPVNGVKGVNGNLYAPSAVGQLSAPAVPQLPPARFSSNAPVVRNPVIQQNLPTGTSTNLMGRMMKPQQPVATAPPAPARHQLLSRPTSSQARHLSNWPYAQETSASKPAQPASKPVQPAPITVQAEPQSVQRYSGDYSTGQGSGGSSMRTSTSVSGRIKRGALLTGN